MTVPVGGDGLSVVPCQKVEVWSVGEAISELLDPLRRVRWQVSVIGVQARGSVSGDRVPGACKWIVPEDSYS